VFEDELSDEGADETPGPPLGPPTLRILAEHDFGVVTQIDTLRLVRLAQAASATMLVKVRVGEFVPCRGVLLEVLSDAGRLDSGAARECIVLNTERLLTHDPAFGIRQLVDIAGRALSPALNDPTTAVQVLDQLHDLLRRLLERRFPSPVLVGRDAGRVITPCARFAEYVALALDEIQVWGKGSLQVRQRVRQLLEDLIACAPPGRRAVLQSQRAVLEGSGPAGHG
jgi:uncharacterized membrane protein